MWFLVGIFDMLTCFVILVSFLKIIFSNRCRKSCQNSAEPMCVPHMNYMHYSRNISIKSPSLCMTTLARVSQTLRSYFSHNQPAHEYGHLHCPGCRNTPTCANPPDLWHQPTLANVTWAWSWGLCGTTLAIYGTTVKYSYYSGLQSLWSIFLTHSLLVHKRTNESVNVYLSLCTL